MRKNFKITTTTIAYTFREVLVIFLALVAICIYLGINFGREDSSTYNMVVTVMGIGFFAFHVFPNLMLTWDYMDQSKTRSLTIGEDNLIIDERNVNFGEIEKIIAVGTYQHFNPPISATSLPYFDYFYFLILITARGEKIVLTSLLGHKLDVELKEILGKEKFEYKYSFFPMIESNMV